MIETFAQLILRKNLKTHYFRQLFLWLVLKLTRIFKLSYSFYIFLDICLDQLWLFTAHIYYFSQL